MPDDPDPRDDTARRVWLGADHTVMGLRQPPLLARAADWMLAEARAGRDADMGGWVVAVPSGRAARQLLAVLADRAAERALALWPPRIHTPGELPAALWRAPAQDATAGQLARSLLWSACVRSAEPAVRLALGGDAPEPRDERAPAHDAPAWGAWARGAVGDLLSAGLWPDQAAEMLADLDGARPERFVALGRLLAGYRAALRQAGLLDPDIWPLEAVTSAAPPACERVVLVGVLEIPGIARRALSLLPERSRVCSLVFDDADSAHLYDALGAVDPAAWLDQPVSLDEASIVRAGDHADQAQAALTELALIAERWAHEHGQPPTPDDVLLGVPDPRLVPHLRRRQDLHGDARVRDASGAPIDRTAPLTLLAHVGEHLRTRSWDSLAALVRHPDMHALIDAWLGRGRWLDDLDRLGVDSAPLLVPPADAPAALARVRDALDAALGELADPALRRSPGQWRPAVASLLARCFGGRPLDMRAHDSAATVRACRAVDEALARAAEARGLEPMAAGALLGALCAAVRDQRVPDDPDARAVEMLGWLELVTDPAPVAIVTGCNAGVLPSSPSPEPFLPGPVRRALALPEATARVARDACVLRTLARSKAVLRLICGSRTAQGDPLLPSPLLFRAPDHTCAARALRLSQDAPPGATRRTLGPGLTAGLAVRQRPVTPAPMAVDVPVTHMHVSWFGEYIASPYQFYLRRVLRLPQLGPRARELSAGAFGSLVHGVIAAFSARHAPGTPPTDPRAIHAELLDDLDRALPAAARRHASPAVELQRAVAQRRLLAFAHWQARRASAGWAIAHCEHALAGPLDLGPGLEPMSLHGKADRIDTLDPALDPGPGRPRVAILDFKTDDSPVSADERARSRLGQGSAWKDLQLPLYRHLFVPDRPDAPPVQLGYVNLSADPDADPEAMADWGPEDLDAALEEARRVALSVRRGRFGDIGRPHARHPPVMAMCGHFDRLRPAGVSADDQTGADEQAGAGTDDHAGHDAGHDAPGSAP